MEMDSFQSNADTSGWRPGGLYWGGIDHLLRNGSSLTSNLDTNAANRTQQFLQEHCKILIIGAGGLGCELLKDVALSGFRNIHVIDLDTIDVTNLNRQFLFRQEDVGKPKAEVAARFVNSRVAGVNVVAHHANITQFDKEFYRQFTLVIAGLDSIDARRWLNAMLVSMVEVDANGDPLQSSVIPLIDGGTEGFQGQARIVIPRITACFECTLGLFPPTQNFPLCTIANTPRLPEHCVEYANVVLWNKLKPFGDVKLDHDSSEHTMWLYERARARAEQFGITGVTYRLTQGVTKNIIPAVAATNAIIAASCANEAIKMISQLAPNMDNFMMYNGKMGVYTYTYESQRRPDCPVCGAPVPKSMDVNSNSTLADFLEVVASDADLRSRNPFIRATAGKTLYASAPAPLRKATAHNLSKKMTDLVEPGAELTLSDRDLPFVRMLIINFT